MNIQATTSVPSIGALTSATTAHRAAVVGSTSTDEIGPAVMVNISDRGALLSELSTLKSSDPAAFTATLTAMSDQARAAAKGATGDEATSLNKMADALASVAKSGDLSALEPTTASAHASAGGAAHAGGAPPSGGASASDSTTSTTDDLTYDPADANKDGTVSSQELAAYEMKHPEKAKPHDTAEAPGAAAESVRRLSLETQ